MVNHLATRLRLLGGTRQQQGSMTMGIYRSMNNMNRNIKELMYAEKIIERYWSAHSES